MGKTADQIESDIEHMREDLKSNLELLESRLKAVVDWRGHVGNHPGPMIVAALIGGALLSAMFKRR